MNSLITGIQNSCPGALNGTPATLFLELINSLFVAQCALAPPIIPDYGNSLKDGDEFDFIIVGGGTTGSVVAKRLSENPNWNVLMLEAGGYPSIINQVPRLWEETIKSDAQTWKYKAEPQKEACQGFKDKLCPLLTGKVLGGTSSINDMHYLRGNPMDYNKWKQNGIAGWDWLNVLSFFKKSEDNLEFGNNTKYHGTGGELKVVHMSDKSQIRTDLKCAASELGYDINKDLNGGKWIGYGDSQSTIFEGKRCTAYCAFIAPAAERPNLFIATNAFVTKVQIDSETKTASGVQVVINDKVLTVTVTKEVIVSAGALRSPALLLHSGIGPLRHLEDMKIPVKQHLPVGQNLQDHIQFIPFIVALRNVSESNAIKENPIDIFYRYLMYNEGPLASLGLGTLYGHINTLTSNITQKYPSIQLRHLYFKKGSLKPDPFFLNMFGLDETIQKNIIELNKKDALLVFVALAFNPKSKGYVQLRSTDPFESPRIFTNYLTDEEDVKTFLGVMQHLTMFLKTKCLSKYKPEILDMKIPACGIYKFKSNGYFRCVLKHMSFSKSHFSGTAKMGVKSDPTAVVSPELKVHGIKHLRVADASIMPNVVSGSTMAPCFMIGEKASVMIKEAWNS